MGGWYPPFFFYSKTIETGRSRYGVSTELVRSIHRRGASLGGGQREKERTVRSFIRSLDGSDRAYIVRTKGILYALN